MTTKTHFHRGDGETITYRGYSSKIEYSLHDCVLFGKLKGINDLVVFEACCIDDIQIAFEQAVDDYLNTCQEVGKSPQKTIAFY